MRELKFRAWGVEWSFDRGIMPHRMWDWYTIKPTLDIWIDDGSSIIMQYTGLNDVNNKEIYEGDIISIPGDYSGDHYYKTSIGIVEYQAPEFYPKNPNDKDGITWQDFNLERCTILGNIYENPELLENK